MVARGSMDLMPKRPAGERLGRVLTDVLTGREPEPVHPAHLAGSARRRAFVATLEGQDRRERPRLGAIALAIVLCLAGAAARVLWPLVAAHLPHAG
jgi:hypothetical protein